MSQIQKGIGKQFVGISSKVITNRSRGNDEAQPKRPRSGTPSSQDPKDGDDLRKYAADDDDEWKDERASDLTPFSSSGKPEERVMKKKPKWLP